MKLGNHESVLTYFYSLNSVPVWVLDGDGAVFWTSAAKPGLKSKEDLARFFKYFKKKAKAGPKVNAVNDVEFFAYFNFMSQDNKEVTAVIGPTFNAVADKERFLGKLSLNYIYESEMQKTAVLGTPVLEARQFCRFLQAVTELLLEKTCDIEELLEDISYLSLKTIIDKQVSEIMFDLRENKEAPLHMYEREKAYLECVRKGDLKGLSELGNMSVPPLRGGTISEYNQNVYLAVAAITLATRAAIEGGVDSETAYTTSDLFIQKIDNAKSANEVAAIGGSVFEQFTQMVEELSTLEKNKYAPAVWQSMEYIRKNLHNPINLDDLAKELNMNAKYISYLFKKQTGKKITDYIAGKRIEESKDLLVNSAYSVAEISTYLSFSSQSYFIKIFSKHEGMTPQKFREANKKTARPS